MKKITAALVAFAGIALWMAGTPALGQGFPAKPIKFIVPYPPGGGADIFARTISQRMSENFGQPIIVENKPGANGIIGTDFVAKSAPDGYTILMGNIGPNAINQALYPALPYDSIKDFSPIALTGYTAQILAVRVGLAVDNVQELIALAKKTPGKLTFASAGIGGSPHLAGELFMMLTGTKIVHVPYKGAAPANSDLVSGQVDLTFNTLPPLLQFARSGRIKALAVTGRSRAQSLPDVPTISEAGVKGYDVTTWYGIFAAPKTPAETVAILNAAIVKVLNAPDVRQTLTKQGYEVATSTPLEFSEFVKSEVARWKQVVSNAGVKAE